MELFLSLWQYIGEGFGLFLVVACAALVIYLLIRRFHSRRVNFAIGTMLAGAALAVFIPNGIPTQLEIPLSLPAGEYAVELSITAPDREPLVARRALHVLP